MIDKVIGGFIGFIVVLLIIIISFVVHGAMIA